MLSLSKITKVTAQRKCTIFVQVPKPGWNVTKGSKGHHRCYLLGALKSRFPQNTLKTDHSHKNLIFYTETLITCLASWVVWYTSARFVFSLKTWKLLQLWQTRAMKQAENQKHPSSHAKGVPPLEAVPCWGRDYGPEALPRYLAHV